MIEFKEVTGQLGCMDLFWDENIAYSSKCTKYFRKEAVREISDLCWLTNVCIFFDLLGVEA